MTTDFQLIESMLWTSAEGYHLLDGHLERLRDSALHYGFPLDKTALMDELEANAGSLVPGSKYKVRLLLYMDGIISITSTPITAPDPSARLKVAMSPVKVSSANDFLYHKTTNRELYNRLHKEYSERGFYDVIFENERGELTEGSRNNLVLKLSGSLFTPPVSCGLLNGVYRRAMAAKGELGERVMTVNDMNGAEAIYCCNSVRGMVEVNFVAG